jgi:hypothetical protein
MKSRHGKLLDLLKKINLAKAHPRAGALFPLFGVGILAQSHAFLGGDLVELGTVLLWVYLL